MTTKTARARSVRIEGNKVVFNIYRPAGLPENRVWLWYDGRQSYGAIKRFLHSQGYFCRAKHIDIRGQRRQKRRSRIKEAAQEGE